MADPDERGAAKGGELPRAVFCELQVVLPNHELALLDVFLDAIALAVLQPGQCS